MPDITLDPADPFEAALVRMVETNRKKRSDYTVDPKGDPFWNFTQTANQVGTTPRMVVEMNIAQKQARLCALLTSGREPANEAVEDTIEDRAVYAVIALAMLQEDAAAPALTGISNLGTGDSEDTCSDGDHRVNEPHLPSCYAAAATRRAAA